MSDSITPCEEAYVEGMPWTEAPEQMFSAGWAARERYEQRTDVVVEKTNGAYSGSTWRVVARFRVAAGERVVAEAVAIPGLLHIFDPAQLEVVR